MFIYFVYCLFLLSKSSAKEKSLNVLVKAVHIMMQKTDAVVNVLGGD